MKDDFLDEEDDEIKNADGSAAVRMEEKLRVLKKL